MDSELKIEYHIHNMFGKRTITDFRAEALASHEEGMFVDEVHITTWDARERGVSGKNIVIYDWEQPNGGK